MFLVHWRHIIQSIKIWQVLQVGPAFHQLLSAAVQQTDMRVATFYDLAVQLQHQPQHTMRGRVLWAKVNIEIADFLLASQSVVKIGAVHYAPPSWQ